MTPADGSERLGGRPGHHPAHHRPRHRRRRTAAGHDASRGDLLPADLPGPVALWASARPRLLLFASTTGGSTVPDRLPGGLPEGALLHSTGSYVPLPPSRVRTGDVVWMRPPQALDWHLPELGQVLDVLARRLGGDTTEPAGPAPPPDAPPTGAQTARPR